MAEQTISITINDERKEVDASLTGTELFAENKDIIAVRLNGEPRDLYTPLHDGDVVEPITLDSEDGLAIMRHSATHVMAQAVQEIRPDAKLGIGPVIKNGFYYDFDVKDPFTPEDLKEIEKRMQRIIKSAQSFRRRAVTEEEARAEEADQPYKLELIGDKEAALDPEAATEVSQAELSMYDNVDREGKHRLEGPVPRPAPAEHPLHQGLQAGARGSRLLARLREESDAAAHLRHRMGQQG